MTESPGRKIHFRLQNRNIKDSKTNNYMNYVLSLIGNRSSSSSLPESLSVKTTEAENEVKFPTDMPWRMDASSAEARVQSAWAAAAPLLLTSACSNSPQQLPHVPVPQNELEQSSDAVSDFVLAFVEVYECWTPPSQTLKQDGQAPAREAHPADVLKGLLQVLRNALLLPPSPHFGWGGSCCEGLGGSALDLGLQALHAITIAARSPSNQSRLRHAGAAHTFAFMSLSGQISNWQLPFTHLSSEMLDADFVRIKLLQVGKEDD
mmetsp:Transcript_3500/g.4733  ORF Transcript_3500/g.4733 Transcript_3500/m.4733 type:complete len:263 (+) Transcript_3500:40-828(+)